VLGIVLVLRDFGVLSCYLSLPFLRSRANLRVTLYLPVYRLAL
jgi:hypothetical protein